MLTGSVRVAFLGFRRGVAIAGAASLPLLLQGCAVIPAIAVAPLAIDAALLVADAVDTSARESSLRGALSSRTFDYPLPVVCGRSLRQAARHDGRTIEPARQKVWSWIVSYPAPPSAGTSAGAVLVECYSRGHFVFSTTVVVLPGRAGDAADGLRVGEHLLDALAADLAGIAHRSVTTTLAADAADVFDALAQVGAVRGRKVLARDAAACSLRVSYPFFLEGRNAEGALDIACRAEGSRTIVTLVGDDTIPELETRRGAEALLADLAALLGLPE